VAITGKLEFVCKLSSALFAFGCKLIALFKTFLH